LAGRAHACRRPTRHVRGELSADGTLLEARRIELNDVGNDDDD
jgi:hypothetical protein